MRISKRIREIEKLIPEGSIVADIGCDHAYLSTLAVLHGKAIKCYACDIAQGPLENAKKTIRDMNCEDRVFPVLSNGLEKVPQDADVCVISGMGFETLKAILEDRDLSQFKFFILQINGDVYDLRKWIIAHDMKITNERIIHEGHFYTILVVQHGHDDYSEEDYIFGKYLQGSVFKEYWQFRKQKIQEILQNIHDQKQMDELAQLLKMIQRKTDA